MTIFVLHFLFFFFSPILIIVIVHCSYHYYCLCTGVSVYTIANAANQFVTISSGHAPDKDIIILCFNKSDAQGILQKVRTGESELKGDAKIVGVSLDEMYALACESASTLGPLMAFRFLPDR